MNNIKKNLETEELILEVENDIIEEVIDLEFYAKEGKQVPKGKIYNVRIDKITYKIKKSEITGRELLELSHNIPPENYRLDQKFKGGFTKKIELDEVVDLTTPGVEKFMTIALDQTEG